METTSIKQLLEKFNNIYETTEKISDFLEKFSQVIKMIKAFNIAKYRKIFKKSGDLIEHIQNLIDTFIPPQIIKGLDTLQETLSQFLDILRPFKQISEITLNELENQKLLDIINRSEKLNKFAYEAFELNYSSHIEQMYNIDPQNIVNGFKLFSEFPKDVNQIKLKLKELKDLAIEIKEILEENEKYSNAIEQILETIENLNEFLSFPYEWTVHFNFITDLLDKLEYDKDSLLQTIGTWLYYDGAARGAKGGGIFGNAGAQMGKRIGAKAAKKLEDQIASILTNEIFSHLTPFKEQSPFIAEYAQNTVINLSQILTHQGNDLKRQLELIVGNNENLNKIINLIEKYEDYLTQVYPNN
ncbi:MAG: hypothetical protein ACP6IY_22450 [Promethearchaeia archaeon]